MLQQNRKRMFSSSSNTPDERCTRSTRPFLGVRFLFPSGKRANHHKVYLAIRPACISFKQKAEILWWADLYHEQIRSQIKTLCLTKVEARLATQYLYLLVLFC